MAPKSGRDPSGSKINRLKAPTAATLSLLSLVALSACGDKVEAVPSPTETTTSDTAPTATETPMSTPSTSPTMEVSEIPTTSPAPTTESPAPGIEITPNENWTAINAEFTQTMDTWEGMPRGDKVLFMRSFTGAQVESFDPKAEHRMDEPETAVQDFFTQLNLISNLWSDVTVDNHREYAANLVEGVTRDVSNDIGVDQITQDLSNNLDFILSDECNEDWCVTSRKDNYIIEEVLGISDRAFVAVDADGTPMNAVAATVIIQNPPDSNIPASSRTKTVVLDVSSTKPIAIAWLHGTNVTVEYNGPGTGETYVGDLLEENQNVK